MHHVYLPLDHPAIDYDIRRGYGDSIKLRSDARQWILDNVGTERLNRREPWEDDTWYQCTTICHKTINPIFEIMFKYRKDAMLFKLTWI